MTQQNAQPSQQNHPQQGQPQQGKSAQPNQMPNKPGQGGSGQVQSGNKK